MLWVGATPPRVTLDESPADFRAGRTPVARSPNEKINQSVSGFFCMIDTTLLGVLVPMSLNCCGFFCTLQLGHTRASSVVNPLSKAVRIGNTCRVNIWTFALPPLLAAT